MVSKTYSNNEKDKFRDVADGVAVAVTQLGSGSLLEGVTFDYIGVAYPTSTQEVYTYRSGGAGGTVQATLTVDYVAADKEQVSSVART